MDVSDSVSNVLFHRDFHGLTGGHLKVWHYFNHINSTKNYQAQVYFTPDSCWQENPWESVKHLVLDVWEPAKADILFLAGMDWLALAPSARQQPPCPVINLIQHVRHANPNNPLFEFLSYPATRICVSQEVAHAISSTGRVNGTVFVIPNGIDFSVLDKTENARLIDLLIVGYKQRLIAKKVAENLKVAGYHPIVLLEQLPRAEYLKLIASANVTLFLPNPTEGFYLPALEGMALGTLVICPDCVGNREFCNDNDNCLFPVYSIEALLCSVGMAACMKDHAKQSMLQSARQTVKCYDMQREESAFRRILGYVGGARTQDG